MTELEKNFRWIDYEHILNLLENREDKEIRKIIRLQQRKETTLEELEKNHQRFIYFFELQIWEYI